MTKCDCPRPTMPSPVGHCCAETKYLQSATVLLHIRVFCILFGACTTACMAARLPKRPRQMDVGSLKLHERCIGTWL